MKMQMLDIVCDPNVGAAKMRDTEPSKTSSLTLHGTAGATAILLRQYFFELRVLKEWPYLINPPRIGAELVERHARCA